jgi:hypothetical protein
MGILLWTLPIACAALRQGGGGVDQAQAFIRALDAGNVDAMMASSEEPFYVRTQEWESARDGIGFVLGDPKDEVFVDSPSLKAFLQTLVRKVRVDSATAATNAPPREELLQDQLKGAPITWSRLELYVFRRGVGDVEHVALVGVEPKSGKVVGLYLN